MTEQSDPIFGEISYVFQGPDQKHYVQTYPLFAPAGTNSLCDDNPLILPTYLRTIYNQQICLRMIEGHSGTADGTRYGPDGNKETYKVPSGTFQLIVPEGTTGSPAPYHLLCGLAGTESIAFHSGDFITFHPGKPAFAPQFPINQIGQVELLKDDYTTAWVSITPGPTGSSLTGAGLTGLTGPGMTAVNYTSQPQQAALFYSPSPSSLHPSPTGPTTTDQVNILDTLFAPAAQFGVTALRSGPSALSYPLVPYSGTSPGATAPAPAPLPFSWDDLTNFEQHILNPLRRQKISDYGTSQQITLEEGPMGATIPPGVGMPSAYQASALPGATVTAMTPQGLLATVDQNNPHWYSITFAKSVWDGKAPTGASADPGLIIDNVADPLRDALQSNQLFLVVSQSEKAQTTPILGTFKQIIGIDNWVFNVDVQKNNKFGQGDTDYSNVMIFKFRPGKLTDLIKHQGYWTQPNTFNPNPDNVQSWVQSYLAEAYQLAQLPGHEDYKDIATLMDNPAWTGILVLKVDVNLQEFPQQLKGLLVGIDLSRFYAHHIGVNISQVKVDQSYQLDIPKSSLFGLISYIAQDSDSSPTVSSTSTGSSDQAMYDFQVLTLKVLFRNSKIKDFKSHIQLTTNKWFNSLATLETDSQSNTLPQHTIEMDGHYENHDGQDIYTFVTRANQYYTFYLDSQVVRYVEVVKAQFNTLSSENVNNNPQIQDIESAFSLWGYLNFYAIPEFDIFSFGSTADAVQDRQGLYFSNLAIDMDFTLDTTKSPPGITGPDFSFNADRATFDTSQSTVRAGSLFSRFPMSIKSLQVSDPNQPPKATKTPTDLGFVTVEMPVGFNPGGLSNTWYGLHCQLKLGSMGALASKAGFTGELLLAWSPSKGVSTMIGIKMPDSHSKGFHLQDILKVSIKDFAIVKQSANTAVENEAEDTPPPNYTLKFDHIGLKLLGINLPPSAQLDLYLFGGETATTSSLGWYGAYIADTGGTATNQAKEELE